MAPKPSRTTKKARELLLGRSVDVAVPAERLEDEATDDTKPSLLERARQTAASGSERDVVLAFGDHGISVLATKPSNPGLPAALLHHVADPPELVDDSDRGLVVRLDGEDHRIGPIHAGSVRGWLAPEPATDDQLVTEESALETEAEPAAVQAEEQLVEAVEANAAEVAIGAADDDAPDAVPVEGDDSPATAEAPAPEPIPILDDFGPSPVQDAVEPDDEPTVQTPDSDGPKVPTNKTTTRVQQIAPAAGVLYAVPARAEQPVLRPGENELSTGARSAARKILEYVPLIGIALAGTKQRNPHDVVLAFDADGTRVFTTSARNPAVPQEEALRIANDDGPPELISGDRSGVVVTVAHLTFTVGPIYADGLRSFLALEDRPTDMAPISNAWTEVVQEFENQFRLPSDLNFPVENRSRSTIQCQRLLPNRWVALAVPGRAAPRPDSEDRKGNFVIAFTDEGPWLFEASGGNPALPRVPIGLIDDASPISFGPHEREGGVLTFNGRTFLIPIAYADSVRQLIVEMAQASAEPG
jgi:hypothetical protein